MLTRLGGKEWLLFLGFSNVYVNSRKELVLVTESKGSTTISVLYYYKNMASGQCRPACLAVYNSGSGEMDCITTLTIDSLCDFIKSHTSIDLEAFSW